jgi:hypothetical protein
MATAQSQLQTSLGSLAGVLAREMNALLDDRLDRLDNRRIEALAMAALILLLVLAAVIIPLTGRRRQPPAPSGDRPGDRPGRDMSVGPGGSDPYGHNNRDPVPPYGDEVYPTRRERSGALR